MDSLAKSPCILVLFGGTGDLAHRKLIPALYNLSRQNCLPDDFAIVAAGRRNKTDEEFRNEAYNSAKKYSRFEIDDKNWSLISSRMYYKMLDFSQSDEYKGLSEFLTKLDSEYSTSGNRIYYLATAPEYFETIIDSLHLNGMVQNNGASWQRVVVEKPFGSDLKTARQLNRKIAEVFEERSTYRIDHYLGKEMVQSIMALRFTNSLFEPLWNRKYIDNIQISACETIGIESRGRYYDKAGALLDMVQNHLLQILALIAMEEPRGNDAEAVRDSKVNVLRAIKDFMPSTIAETAVFGQYSEGEAGGKVMKGYRQEENVLPGSLTETFAALKVELQNDRWEGVPFYIRTGKRLAARFTEIVIQFRTPAAGPYNSGDVLEPNLLVIRIQPKEELSVRFNTKKPGINSEVTAAKMNYCQKCKACEAEINSPEAYEKLIVDIIKGDTTLFARWDEVEKSWEIIEMIKKAAAEGGESSRSYKAGTWGPAEADGLLSRDNRRWWRL